MSKGPPLSIPQRVDIHERAACVMKARSEEYALLAAKEGGKPLLDSRVEVARAIQGTYEAARSISHLTGRRIPMNLNAASMNRMAILRGNPWGLWLQ